MEIWIRLMTGQSSAFRNLYKTTKFGKSPALESRKNTPVRKKGIMASRPIWIPLQRFRVICPKWARFKSACPISHMVR